MRKSKICIVIPIYKEVLNEFEIQSVKQCVKILSEYSLNFVCPFGINIDFYKEKFPGIKNFSFFGKDYFKGIEGYNKLMLSPDFYKAFDDFEYMLVYQTDCYVFRDELLDWAIRGYDYIGGVWFEDYHGNPNLGAKLWYPGNGGLSLRNINKIINILTSKRPVKNWHQILDEKEFNRKKVFYSLKELLLIPLNILGYENNFKFIASNYKLFEDVFFMEVGLIYNQIKIPSMKDANLFSWDKNPKYLFDKFKCLPFACHAWFRDDSPYEGNKEFWLRHINNKLL
ncbi:MAG: DUF5672 family protein [Lutibacter sp.]